MSKRKKKPAPVAAEILRLSINGRELSGEARGGKWSFVCPSWPELAARHEGAASAVALIEEFVPRAIASAIHVQDLANTLRSGNG